MFKSLLLVTLVSLVGYVTLFNAVICPNYTPETQTLVFPINLHDCKDTYLSYIGTVNNYLKRVDTPETVEKVSEKAPLGSEDTHIVLDFSKYNHIVNTSPIFKYSCHYCSDETNKFIRDVKFNYKIYVQTKVAYYYHFYYPSFKMTVIKTLSQIWAKISYHYSVISTQIQHFCEQNDTLRRVFDSISTQNHHFNDRVVFLRGEVQEFVGSKFSKVKLKLDYKTFYNDHIKNIIKSKEEPEDSETSDPEYYYDSNDDSDGPITVKLTSTIYESIDSQPSDLMIQNQYTEDELEVKSLLSDFEIRINNTVDLALMSISHDINPFINETIESLKDEVTEIFKGIQNRNYQYYKESNQLISQIDKDISKIKTTNKTVETVSRQDMRDLINDIKFYNNNQIQKVEAIINEKFEILMNKYLLVIQSTINVLESFIDASFQNFEFLLSNKMSQLTLLDEFTWNNWKQFHNLKSVVLDSRDYIFDQANLLKSQKFDELSLDNDFSNWLSFLKSMDTHLSYVSTDNDEYLQLIRAKANVSYQLREQAVLDLGETPESHATFSESMAKESLKTAMKSGSKSTYSSTYTSDPTSSFSTASSSSSSWSSPSAEPKPVDPEVEPEVVDDVDVDVDIDVDIDHDIEDN